MSIAKKMQRKSKEQYYRLHQLMVDMGILPRTKSYTRFVILSDIRSGSTMLTSYLNSHPNMRVFFEPFHIDPSSIPFSVDGYSSKSSSMRVVKSRNHDPAAFAENHIFSWMPRRIQAVGFKLLHTQARKKEAWFDDEEFSDWWAHVNESDRLRWRNANSDLWEFLRLDLNLRVILLHRENPLKALVSSKIAKVTGKWGKGATGGVATKDDIIKVTLDTNTMIRDFKAQDRYVSDAKLFFDNHHLLETSYEKISADPVGELLRVQEFLGVPVATMATNTIKQQTKAMSDVVNNWLEVSALLKEHDLAHLMQS